MVSALNSSLSTRCSSPGQGHDCLTVPVGTIEFNAGVVVVTMR